MNLQRYQKRAIRKKLSFDLTMEWLKEKLDTGTCEVTGLRFKLQPNNSTINPYLPSVDRIDPNKGYIKDNCQLVIIGFNNLKSGNDMSEVIKFCRGYVEYYEHTKNLLG